MTRPRVGASPTGQTHYLDDEGGPLCNVRVGDVLNVNVDATTPTCQRCRTKYARPCPFCGGEPTFFEPSETGDPGSLWCKRCDVSGPSRNGFKTYMAKDGQGREWPQQSPQYHENRLQVYEAWNHRPKQTGD